MAVDYKYLSWLDIEECCKDIFQQMRKNNYIPNAILGLSRGGVIPARLFSDYFDIVEDFFSLDVKMYNGIKSTIEEAVIRPFHDDIKGKTILILDDIWDSGMTMRAVLEYLRGEDITTATLFWNSRVKDRPDYYAKVTEENSWCVFPWEHFEFEREKLKL